MSRIYVIHENDAWVEPLRAAFAELRLPYTEWFTAKGRLDLASVPPPGVFYNRMSASSHTRGHRYAAELTGGLLAWLESHGRRVINNGRALSLEISKIAQYAALAGHGIRVPHTIAAVGRDAIVDAAKTMPGRFITKHNRAGKGLGVRLFDNVDALTRYADSDAFEDSVDGITLIQQYIEAPEPFITRVEFVGGKFLYAVRVDTSLGFELCPADVCQVDDAFCPVGESAPATACAALPDRRRIFAPDRRALSALHRGQRHRHRGHRVHHRPQRRALHVRRQHEHQLQQRRGAPGRPVRHARDRVVPGRGAARARPAIGRRARGRVDLRIATPNGRWRIMAARSDRRQSWPMHGKSSSSAGHAPRSGITAARLKDIPPTELGARVVREAIARSKVDAAQIGQCVFGNVIHTEQKDMYLSRVVAVNGGLPHESGALTVNRLCGSGLQAIVSAAQYIMLGDIDAAVGGGAESMSRGAYANLTQRWGARMDDTKVVDMMVGALTDPFDTDPHGHHRRERRDEVRHHARAAGCVRRRKPPASRERDRRQAASSRRSFRSSSRAGRVRFSSTPTSMRAATPAPRAWRSSARCSQRRTAPSRRATRPGINDAAAAVVLMEHAGRRAQRREADGAARRVRPRGHRPEDHGPGAGDARSIGAREGGPEDRRHRRDRVERSVRRAGARRQQGSSTSTRRR